jgi:hypothetical protein
MDCGSGATLSTSGGASGGASGSAILRCGTRPLAGFKDETLLIMADSARVDRLAIVASNSAKTRPSRHL